MAFRTSVIRLDLKLKEIDVIFFRSLNLHSVYIANIRWPELGYFYVVSAAVSQYYIV